MGRKKTSARMARLAFCGVLCLCLVGGLFPARALETEAPEEAVYEEAMRQYYLRRAEMLTDLGQYHTWTLENKAELDDMMHRAGYWDIHHIVPGEEDLSEAEAIAAGKEAILEAYDFVTAAELDRYAVYTDLYRLSPEDDTPQRLWILQYETPADDAEEGTFRVEMDSPSGVIELCLWYPGVLTGLLQETQQPAKAEFSQVPPAGATISEAEAVRIAREAVLRQYGVSDGITEHILRGFWASIWLREDQNLWQVEFQSPDAEVQGALGGYMVYISPKTGEVHSVEHGGNG